MDMAKNRGFLFYILDTTVAFFLIKGPRKHLVDSITSSCLSFGWNETEVKIGNKFLNETKVQKIIILQLF
jgi:hypothetical protein